MLFFNMMTIFFNLDGNIYIGNLNSLRGLIETNRVNSFINSVTIHTMVLFSSDFRRGRCVWKEIACIFFLFFSQ